MHELQASTISSYKGTLRETRTSLYNNKFERLVIVKRFLLHHSAHRDANIEERPKGLVC